MTILVFGASGFLGSALMRFFDSEGIDAIGTYGNTPKKGLFRFDLREPDIDALLKESNVDVDTISHAIICSAVTNMDLCKTNWDETYEINVVGTKKLISALFERGIIPVFISTDYVFEGLRGNYSEDDERKPVLAYGMHKKEIEDFFLSGTAAKGSLDSLDSLDSIYNQYIIARMSKMYGLDSSYKTLLTGFIEDLRNGKELILADDQIFSPTLVDDVCKALYLLMERSASGVFNVCASEPMSRYDIGVMVKESIDIKAGSIKPCKLDDLKEKFKDKRPLDTSLNNTKFCRTFDFSFTTIEESLEMLKKK